MGTHLTRLARRKAKNPKAKSESGDFGHDHFLPPSPPLFPLWILVIILCQLTNRRSSRHRQFHSLRRDDRQCASWRIIITDIQSGNIGGLVGRNQSLPKFAVFTLNSLHFSSPTLWGVFPLDSENPGRELWAGPPNKNSQYLSNGRNRNNACCRSVCNNLVNAWAILVFVSSLQFSHLSCNWYANNMIIDCPRQETTLGNKRRFSRVNRRWWRLWLKVKNSDLF